VEPLNERYAELCSDLTSAVREVEQSAKIPDQRELARLWTGSIDARGYMIFGDPAVRLIAAHVPPKLAEEAPMAQVDTATREPAPSVRRSSLDESAPTDAAMPRTVLATGASRLRIEVDTQTGRITVTTSGAAPDAPDEVSGEDSPGEIAYGLFGGQAGQKLVDLRSSLADGLKSAADQLTGALGQLMSEASTLEVTTYSSEDLDEVEYDARAERFAVMPSMSMLLRISETTGQKVDAIALRCQIRIDPTSRIASPARTTSSRVRFSRPGLRRRATGRPASSATTLSWSSRSCCSRSAAARSRRLRAVGVACARNRSRRTVPIAAGGCSGAVWGRLAGSLG